MAMIARAIPAACRRVRNQKTALRLAKAEPALLDVRADFRANLIAFYEVHVRWASWGGEGRAPAGITEPTRKRVCELTGMSESTYKACRRWWEARGYLTIVRPGSTPDCMPAVLRTSEDHNIRQAYVLCAPRRPRAAPCEKNQPAPPDTCTSPVIRPLSSPRSGLDRFPARPNRPGGKPPEGAEPATAAPPRPREFGHGPLKHLTEGWWSYLTAPFAAAGWTVADLVFAINHVPGGRSHKHTIATMRNPVGWLRWRLSHWLTGGVPLTSPSQQKLADLAADRAEQAARRAEQAAIAEKTTADNEGNAAVARRMLNNRRGPGAPPLRAAERSRPRPAPAPCQTHHGDAGRPAAASTAPQSPPSAAPAGP